MTEAKEHVFSEFVTVQSDTEERSYFVAAALTCGFDLAENTPMISNTYSLNDKYERGQFGDVRMLLEARSADGIPLPLFAKVWRDWDEPMTQATEIARRVNEADTTQKVMNLIQGEDDWPGVEWLIFTSALAHMRLFTLRRISLPNLNAASDEEIEAANILDGIAERFSDPSKNNKRMRLALAKSVAASWKPAMVSWVKAFTVNYLEIRDIWRKAPESIKIDRGEGRLPLVIPKGPDFKKMLDKWT